MTKWLVCLLVLGVALVGCGTAEVDSTDVKDWQNQGRAPGDKAPDPNSATDR